MKNKTQGKIKVFHVCRAKDSSHSYMKHLILKKTIQQTIHRKPKIKKES